MSYPHRQTGNIILLMYKMYKINNAAKKILTFDVLCVIVKLTIKVVSLGELRLADEALITTHLVYNAS